jgi:predicted Zn-dependent peptidase
VRLGGTQLSRWIVAAVLVVAAARAQAGLLQQARKTTPAQLAVGVQRYVLENGLVVVLAPDPGTSSVAVWTTFRAGAIREPAGKTGIAHLVEHLLASGPTPETDYAGILEARRARHFNAHTGFDVLAFETVVPAEELPVALWVAADRLGTLALRVDAREIERNRRVVEQERALRTLDRPYGLADEQLFRRLYAAPHPLHGAVIGVPEELATVGVEDVRRFVDAYLVPANGVLVVSGRFDLDTARELIAGTLGRLPGGRRAPDPKVPPPPAAYVDVREEPHAREPRVTLAWRIPGAGREDTEALRLGAQLLTFFTDGAWGMRLGAALAQYEGEALFSVELTVPYDEPMEYVHRDADGFLRMLTHKEMPLEFLIAANLALDRFALFELETLEGRARALSALELRHGATFDLSSYLGWHWAMEGDVVRDTARRHLTKGPKLVLHARPKRPKKARAERE